jgi:hypothetical protein
MSPNRVNYEPAKPDEQVCGRLAPLGEPRRLCSFRDELMDVAARVPYHPINGERGATAQPKSIWPAQAVMDMPSGLTIRL